MKVRTQRRLLVFVMAAAVPVVAASAAFACQSLATLRVTPNSGPSGTSVTATGSNYNTAASSSDVVLHLDARNGAELARTRPSARGSINVTFPVRAATGGHVIVATQYSADGTPRAGTPGRASFNVTSAGVASASASPLSPIALTSPIALAGFALLGAIGVVSRRRRRTASAA
jgi:LPXTG-motif cell wall-anchored protein